MIVIQWSEDGTPFVTPGTGPRLLSDFFRTDLQDYGPRIQQISELIEQCKRGESVEPVRFYGNVYELELGCEKVVLTNLYASIPPESVPFSDFKVMFDIWVAALKSRRT